MAVSCLVVVGSWIMLAAQPASAPIAVPYHPDPPPAIDGALDEWQGRRPTFVLDWPEQAVYGRQAWKSPADLSGRIWLAWREGLLYLAAEVTDDQHRQEQRGTRLFGGDCVQLFLDVAPDDQPQRESFGPRQFQIAFSPGNFQRTGDALTDIAPEAFCYRPEGQSLAGTLVAAQRTATGYMLEAAVAWPALLVKPQPGFPLNLEVALSDTDGTEAKPEKLMTSSTAKWSITRGRLQPAVLARADGTAPTLARETPLFEAATLQQSQQQAYTFQATRPAEGRDAVVRVLARLDHKKAAGYSHALFLKLNGTVIDGDRLVERPLRYTDNSGRINSAMAQQTFNVHYAPDFTAADKSSYAIPGARTGEFQFRVGDLLRDGPNELVIQNRTVPAVKTPLVLAEGRLRDVAAQAVIKKEKAGPPTGPLPVIEPVQNLQTAFGVTEPSPAALEIAISGETFRIQSEFSTPDGKWQSGSNTFFRHRRRIERRDEALIVCDSLENLGDENLPLVQRHRARPAGELAAVWLSGLKPAGLTGTATDPANPTCFAATTRAGLGLLPLNDEFQVHVHNAAAAGEIVLSDREFVLRPKAVYEARFAIVPTARPDYYDFLNAARRLTGANFTIADCFAFLRAGPLTEKWSDQQFADFIRLKSANLVCASISSPRYQGHYPHGTAFQRIAHDSFQRYVERVQRLAPGVRTSVYFHSFIDVVEDSPARFADARVLRVDGQQADYGQPHDKIFFPTAENDYGRAVAGNVDVILDKIKADGVYWDEFEYSAYKYHYGPPWDGCSADIDQRTLKITRLKSSVTLLSQPWRLALARRIQARGPLIANGQPHTPTIAALKFPRFVETGSASNCAKAQYHSPIALGDHLTERSERDAYRNMLSALDYGCVYHWYSDMAVIPTYRTLTEHMYPITPVELRSGYIIGRERILTRRSGLFGWGDAAEHVVHVYDDEGREVADFPAPQVLRDGKRLTELRLPEDYSAAIVRK